MTTLRILQEYSYKHGKEILHEQYPHIAKEIKDILTTTQIGGKTKRSREKGKAGQLVWSGKDFKPLRTLFKLAGWRKEKIELSEKNFVEIPLMKEKVGLNFQLGKYSFVDTDFVKFEIFYLRKRLDIGVEIVPTKALMAEMYSGPPNFDQVKARIQARGDFSPVPLWIIGVSIFGG